MDELYNLNIERVVLSSLLYRGDDEYMPELQVSSEVMYEPMHKLFLDTAKALKRDGKPLDEEFMMRGMSGDPKFHSDIFIEIISSAGVTNVEHYIKELISLKQKRDLFAMTHTIKGLLANKELSSEEIINDITMDVEHIFSSSSSKISSKKIKNMMASEPEFRIKDWLPIPMHTTTLISAEGGTGKTWAALQLAIRIANEDNNAKVFLWLSEDPEGIVKSRYDTIIKNICPASSDSVHDRIVISHAPPPHLLHMSSHGASLSNKFYAMKHDLRGYDVIIIDPLLAFHGGDENSNSHARIFMQPFLNWAMDEKKSIIFLHHAKKGDAIGGKSRGASAIVDAVRCVYEISNIKENDTISHKKQFTVAKDNYGVTRYTKSIKFERDITPAQLRVVAYEYQMEMPSI